MIRLHARAAQRDGRQLSLLAEPAGRRQTAAGGERVEAGLADGRVIVIFSEPAAVGWVSHLRGEEHEMSPRLTPVPPTVAAPTAPDLREAVR